ncbi:hypothetical protein TVAG_399680 [Trichomonas vaginalis G3]|uniref:Uncharacterized protein n=1 Tax=Trichomonas vaginalis (strain ATCC PRA-98 / G3) TaxID=412133 RepID=A2E605_TRIV3|nr:guanine nucleotide exchange c9orf72 family [Trichomonas vaginalis G3]EAY11962.1 hypothetical protein TVAG_399680 [Trichomonas vaginalis G3]KAI5530373.1 guanine nucleotide exchange c9orf72 family [Trichomonas vaginalis G3]|eukprot:XP_001324185.1 hypothetical protein [Trichomonas vaginalis G3]
MECIKFAALGSFSKEGEINIIRKWNNVCEGNDDEIKEIVSIILSNANDQPQGHFTRFPLSNLEFQSKKMHVFASSFSQSQSDNSIFYTFAIFVNSLAIEAKPFIQDNITEAVGTIALHLHSKLKNQKHLEKSDDFIMQIFKSNDMLMNSQICNPLPEIVEIKPDEYEFFSTVLTSHLSTQMTTIIECSNEKQAAPLLTFLSHFMLPYQLELSSTEIRDSIVQGLFLQCVKPQKDIPLADLALYQRPWTFVSLKSHTVKQSPDWDSQRQTRVQLRQIHLVSLPSGASEASKKQSAIMAKYRPKIVAETSKWASESVKEIFAADSSIRSSLCAIRLSEIVHQSLAIIKMSEALMNEKQQMFLGPDHVRLMNKTLDMDDDDLKMAVGVATAFDPKISSSVYTGCHAVITKMLIAV